MLPTKLLSILLGEKLWWPLQAGVRSAYVCSNVCIQLFLCKLSCVCSCVFIGLVKL